MRRRRTLRCIDCKRKVIAPRDYPHDEIYCDGCCGILTITRILNAAVPPVDGRLIKVRP